MTVGLLSIFGVPSGPAFAPLALGAGGWITGVDVHSDGTLVCRTDTFGGYLGNVAAGTRWQQMLTTASMPALSVGFDATGNFAPGIGVYEIRIAPSNSSVFYMLYSDSASQTSLSMFKSTNKGAAWTKLAAFTALNVTWPVGTENDPYRMCSQKMAVHPTDPNTVLVGTPVNGLYYTTDGGNSFTPAAGVTAGAADGNGIRPGITGICFDPATPTACYAASFGNGVYRSTAGVTGTWSLLSGSPQFVSAAMVSAGGYWSVGKASSTGVTGGNGFATILQKYNGTSFSTSLTDTNNGLQSICFVTPSTIIVTTAGGQLWVSVDTGGTWNGPSFSMPISSADIPWLAHTAGFFSAGGLVADPITSGRIIQGVGIGVLTINMTWSAYSFATTTPWVSQSAGIEQLVARKIISPPGGTPIIAVEDRGCFYLNDPTTYPPNYSTQPLSSGNNTCASYDVDYAKSAHGTIAEVSNGLSTDVSGLSSSGGAPGTWSAFTSNPNLAGLVAAAASWTTSSTTITMSSSNPGYGGRVYDNNTGFLIGTMSSWIGTTLTLDAPALHASVGSSDNLAFVSNRNGNLAISTPTNIVFFNLYNDAGPKYTTDGGSTWTASTGLPATGWAPGGNSFGNAKLLCADDAGNGTFYLYNGNGNIYRSADNGASWSSILSGIVLSSYFEPTLISVPGQAGNIFFAPGYAGAANLPIGNLLYRSQDANGGSPTKTTVANVKDVWAIGFGAVAAGHSYPTVWIVGWVKVGAAPYKYGIWVSKDNCATWTWLIDFPFNSCDQIVTISGDAGDASKCYYGFEGSGAGYGRNLVY